MLDLHHAAGPAVTYAVTCVPPVKRVFYNGLVHQAWPSQWTPDGSAEYATILCIGFNRYMPQVVQWPLTCLVCLSQEVV